MRERFRGWYGQLVGGLFVAMMVVIPAQASTLKVERAIFGAG